MSRYEVVNDEGRWVFGWDQPLQSYFLHLHILGLPPDENPVLWLGATRSTAMPCLDELVMAARRNGLRIDRPTQTELYADKDQGL